MIFSCNKKIKLYHKQWYNYDDLCTGVGYWANFLKRNTNRSTEAPVGIIPGTNTFSGVCFLLALYYTKTNFAYLDYEDYTVSDYMFIYNVQYIAMVGDPVHSINLPDNCIKTDDFLHGHGMSQFNKKVDLTFDFCETHKIRLTTSGSTRKKTVLTTAGVEADSVKTAMDIYFDDDDVCLFSHEMTHKGVHTTAIFPALFKTSKIYLVSPAEWPQFVNDASHCQWFNISKLYTNITSNVKTITTGGSSLSDESVNYILNESPECTIYDIYGLTEQLPPVAIRKLNRENKNNKIFTLVRPELFLYTEDNELIIQDSKRNLTHKTGDTVELIDQNNFIFVGRSKKEVRINGQLCNQSNVQMLIDKIVKTESYNIKIQDGVLNIFCYSDYKDILSKWCQEQKVEKWNVIVVAEIKSNGGIKTAI